jgi:hypothetical protein
MNAYEGFVLAVFGALGHSMAAAGSTDGAQYQPGVLASQDTHLIYPVLADLGQGTVVAFDPYREVEVCHDGHHVVFLLDSFNPVNPEERADYWFRFKPDDLTPVMLKQAELIYHRH